MRYLLLFFCIWLFAVGAITIYFIYLFTGVNLQAQILNDIIHIFLERNQEIGDMVPK
jgi:hypothetical protein